MLVFWGVPNENSRNLNNSVSAQCSTSFRPHHSVIPTSSFVPIQRGALLDYIPTKKHEFNVVLAVKSMKQQEKL